MLEIVIWDVQYGSASYIKTPNNKHLVIDLGTGSFQRSSKEFSTLLYLKNKYNIDSLDKAIITHPHSDHIEDIIHLQELNPKSVLIAEGLSEKDIRKANQVRYKDRVDKYLEFISVNSNKIKNSTNYMLEEDTGGVKVTSFKPTKCKKSNINNFSIVTVLEYKGIKVLIPGDNEAPSWKELLMDQEFVNAIKNTDIFIASHHGRKSGYYQELFNYFTPKLVIVSDGAETKTSVTDKYSKLASGYEVNKRSDNSLQERHCLTTRNDGVINIKIWEEENKVNMKIFIN